MAPFQANPSRYEPQYGGLCASGAAFAIKLGSDPKAWAVYQGRLFIFGDAIGKIAWGLELACNAAHADEQWPGIRDTGWRAASVAGCASKVPDYQTGARIRAEWLARHPGRRFPDCDPAA